jgi:hypothetical protein
VISGVTCLVALSSEATPGFAVRLFVLGSSLNPMAVILARIPGHSPEFEDYQSSDTDYLGFTPLRLALPVRGQIELAPGNTYSSGCMPVTERNNLIRR